MPRWQVEQRMAKYGIVLMQLMREIPLIPALFRVS
jgi:hypothetical protein